MPSQTFFNLPQAKRDRLIQAAREEFARVPYDQVSINKIIQAALIPRGSFYMYFTNKEDLFLYMVREFMSSPLQLFQQLLEQTEGDPFRAFVALYDYVVQYRPPSGVQDLMQIFRHNASLQRGIPFGSGFRDDWIEKIAGSMDWSMLSVQREEDKREILQILFAVTAPALGQAAFFGGGREMRNRLCAQLDILRRGMQAAAPHPTENKLWQHKGDLNYGNDKN